MPFFYIHISQGSVATRLGCGGAFVYDCYKFPTGSNGERILKIGQYLVKLWARVRGLVFLTHSVYKQAQQSQSDCVLPTSYLQKGITTGCSPFYYPHKAMLAWVLATALCLSQVGCSIKTDK